MKSVLIAFCLFLLFPLTSLGLNYYWVGGSGDWTDINHWATTSGGTLKHIQTPTPSDDVFFDANSGPANSIITLNIPTIVCKTFDVSGLSSIFKFNGVCTNIRIFGGLKLNTKAKWLVNSKFSFESQQGGNIIACNGATVPFDMYFIGLNGVWSLSDNLSGSNIYHKAGTLNTAGKDISCNLYSSSSINTRTLTLSSSKFTVSGINVQGQGFSVNGGTSQIVMTGTNFSVMNCGNQTFYDLFYDNTKAVITSNGLLGFHNVSLKKGAVISTSATYNILYLGKGEEYDFSMSNHTFATDLQADGTCNAYITISGLSTSFVKTSGAVNVHYIQLKGVNAGGGATFNAWSSYDNGGNSGWNIHQPPARTLYWVGGSGNWDDTTHWAASSGGPGGECIPTIVDNVVFNNASFPSNSGTVSVIDSAGNCHDMTWTTTANPIFTASSGKIMRISGSLRFCQQMTNLFQGEFHFVSDDSLEVVKTANHKFNNRVIFSGKGSWKIIDSLKIDDNLIMDKGKLLTDNQYVSCKVFSANSDKWKELYLTTSRIDVTDGLFTLRQDSTFVNPGTSQIHIYSCSSYPPLFRTLYLPQRHFWTVIFELQDKKRYSKNFTSNTKFHKIIYRGNMIKSGDITVDSIFYSAGYDYAMEGIDTVVDYLHAHGYCTKKITFRPKMIMNQAIIYKSSGAIQVNRVHMRGIKAMGNASFTAVNSSDLGNNSGWNFQNIGTNLYWVGYSSSNWSDSLNWSYSSGGSGGACIPTINDNVFFDQNSFSGVNGIVLADAPSVFCKNMTWSQPSSNPVFKTSVASNMFVAGSMELARPMNFNFKGVIYFCDTSKNKHILSSGQDFDSLVCFIDTGAWSLSDSMIVNDILVLFRGHFTTGGKYLKMLNFYGIYSFPKIFDISNSEVVMGNNNKSSGWYWNQNSLASFISTNSDVYFINKKNILNLGGSGTVNFNNIYFKTGQSASFFTAKQGINNSNNKVHFYSSGTINGDHYYDSLIFSKGKVYLLENQTHQYINNYLKATGNCGNTIKIWSIGQKSYINKNQGVVDIHEVLLKNIEAQGQAVFNAYGGADLGGNVNWNFYPNPPRTLFWVGGSGDWEDSLHWSLQSGGPGGECIPTYIDYVIIDTNSSIGQGGPDITINWAGECRTLHWKALAGNFFKGHIDIYGSFLIDRQVDMSNLEIYFKAGTPVNLIRTGNNEVKYVVFKGKGGWRTTDSLSVHDSISFLSGYLQTLGHTVKTKRFNAWTKSYKHLSLGSSKIYLTKQWLIRSDSLILDAGTSDIVFQNGTDYLFSTAGKPASSYYNVSIYDLRTGTSTFVNKDSALVTFNKVSVFNDGNFLNAFTFDSLIFAPGNTYRFQEGRTQKINKYWRIRGNNCYAINLQSTKMYQTAYVFKPSGVVEGDFINMRDIHASGGNIFYAGQFSTDIDNNQNWLFQNGPNYVYGLGHDTTFALGSNVTLNTTNFNGSYTTLYNWSTGSTHDTIVVNKTGWYWVTVTYAGNCVVVDSIYVGCRVDMNFNVTDVQCFGDSNGVIQALIPDTSYTYSFLWSTGDTTAIIQPYPAGDYILTVSADSGKCVTTDTVTINQPPQVTVPQGDTAFCIGDSVMLDLGYFKDYYWADGYKKRTRWVSKADTFFVVVTDSAGCKSLGDTIKVRQDTLPVFTLGPDTVICLDQSIVLSPGVGFNSYLWWDASTGATAEVFYPGKYWVMIQQRTCYVYDTINIENCPPKLTLPNVFTPNGDGLNDYFTPEEQNILDFDMKIYSRWGLRIYHTTDLKHGWDGTYLDQPAAEGVYFFVIHYRQWLGTEPSKIYTAQGSVTLLRNRNR